LKSNERDIEILMAVYQFDMNKISKEMNEAQDYTLLADLYDKSSQLIRQLDKAVKELEDAK